MNTNPQVWSLKPAGSKDPFSEIEKATAHARCSTRPRARNGWRRERPGSIRPISLIRTSKERRREGRGPRSRPGQKNRHKFRFNRCASTEAEKRPTLKMGAVADARARKTPSPSAPDHRGGRPRLMSGAEVRKGEEGSKGKVDETSSPASPAATYFFRLDRRQSRNRKNRR